MVGKKADSFWVHLHHQKCSLLLQGYSPTVPHSLHHREIQHVLHSVTYRTIIHKQRKLNSTATQIWGCEIISECLRIQSGSYLVCDCRFFNVATLENKILTSPLQFEITFQLHPMLHVVNLMRLCQKIISTIIGKSYIWCYKYSLYYSKIKTLNLC